MSQGNRTSGSFSFGPFVWFIGVVEDRMDPEKLGRVKVRIFGYHDANIGVSSSENLFWAAVMMPTNSSGSSGIGYSPTGLIEGSTVVGFFMDGHAAQTPIVIGSLGGKPDKENQIQGGGFKDQSGKYPSYESGEQSVNRLARAEKTDETSLGERSKNLSTASVAGGGSWKEPKSPYAAEYPFNHVRASESGHVFEMDDTKDAERINLLHKSGTFFEVGPDGIKVDKVVKDRYTITLGDDRVLIDGDCFVTVTGDAKILISGDATVEIGGDLKETIGGDYDLTIGGNFTTKLGGDYKIQAGGSHDSMSGGVETRKATMISLN